jgi:hypothetical protein
LFVDTASIISPNALDGKFCFCGIRSRNEKNTGLPTIHLGKYRTLKLCKKQHLTNPEECNKVENFIDLELTKIHEKGDVSANVLECGSQEESPSELQALKKCSGYLNLIEKEKCDLFTDGFLYLQIEKDNETELYFCKASHLVRYLAVHYCKRGRKKSKKSNKSNKINKNTVEEQSQENEEETQSADQ